MCVCVCVCVCACVRASERVGEEDDVVVAADVRKY